MRLSCKEFSHLVINRGGQLIVGDTIPRLIVMDSTRKQAKQAM